MSNENVSRLMLSPDTLPTAFAFFICPFSPCFSRCLYVCLWFLFCVSISFVGVFAFGFPQRATRLAFVLLSLFFFLMCLRFFCSCLRLYFLSLSSSLSLMSNENVLRPSLSPGGREAWLLPRHFFSTSRSTSSFHYCFSLKYCCQYSINISFSYPGQTFSWHWNFLSLI